MRRWWLLLVPGVAVTSAILAVTLPAPAALAFAPLLGVLAAAVLRRLQREHLLGLAEEINRWIGPEGYRTVQLPEETPWRQLAVALNALGAAYARRGRELRLERPWRRELVDSIVGPALLFSDEDRLLAANDPARDLLGIPVDGDPVTLVQALGSAALVSGAREARAVGRPIHVDAELGQRQVRATSSPVGDEILMIITDLTSQRRVDELRRNFVANASHELKTPVTSIQTLTDALDVALERNPKKTRDLVTRLGEESERLARLVHDLLDLRRLEDRGPLELGPVDLSSLVREVVAGVAAEADERGIAVRCDLPESATVAGVGHELRLVVDNLVRNAIQYNQDGGTVSIGLEKDEGTYELTVSDSGIGIPQQALRRIFERFFRVDVARSRERGGTGLGLSIVRHAVHRHGGSIEVESLLGEGSTFHVRLPVEPSR